jgi:hypothetical protein
VVIVDLKRILLWFLFPYVMVFVEWRKANKILKVYGLFCASIILLGIIAVNSPDPAIEDAKPSVKPVVKTEKPKVLTEEEKKEKRKEELRVCFSPWNGSHRNLTEFIKENMNDPDSYEHVETSYYDMTTYLIVNTTFRGNNQFGALVKNTIKAEVSADDKCQVIKILE